VGILVSDYSKENEVMKQLVSLSSIDYSTVLHSINVMALALLFASSNGYSQPEAKRLGLCGLLHDVGKTKIEKEILSVPRKLTDEEFQEMKNHTSIGFNILRKCRFPDKEISLSALEHHEKLDGSGYPNNKTRIFQVNQIIGIIDSYEALTSADRPYRKAMAPFDVLDQVIKKEVKNGRFNEEIYAQFVRTLGNVSK
jgi:putative nucleotidyltransferase with HDIG domain